MASQDPTPRKPTGGGLNQIALAMELPFLLIGPVMLGGAVGYFLDRWLHTKPVLLLVLGVGGVVVGILDAIKIANAQDKKSRE